VGHHDACSTPLGILADVARRLAGLPTYLIGEGRYMAGTVDESVPEPVRR
jgi:hypothetical protein